MRPLIPARRLAAVALVALVAGTAAGSSRAQGWRHDDHGRDRTVYCASNDNRGTRCQMPWRDSLLVQQLSRASCIEGRSWGSDPYTVWVKKGCRGNFGRAHADHRRW